MQLFGDPVLIMLSLMLTHVSESVVLTKKRFLFEKFIIRLPACSLTARDDGVSQRMILMRVFVRRQNATVIRAHLLLHHHHHDPCTITHGHGYPWTGSELGEG